MNRRQFAVLAMGLGTAYAWAAPAAEAAAPIIKAPRILEALDPKSIVLDPDVAPSRRAEPSIGLHVAFAFDSAELLEPGRRQLDELAVALGDAALAGSAFRLAGHTDGVGDPAYNLRLSLYRAEAVKAYLAQVHGLETRRLLASGHGATRLLDPAHPAAALNRRVEVRRLHAATPFHTGSSQ